MSIKEAMEDDGIQTSEPVDHNKNDAEPSKRYADLYVAALEGDWSKAEVIFEKHPGDVRAELSNVGDTVLHVAAKAGKNDFLKELVSKYMEEDDLKKKNKEDNTAFLIAVMWGATKLAEFMLKKSEDLAMICNGGGMLPVLVAAYLGHEKMVKYLYAATKDKLTEEDRIELLVALIDKDLYDVALDMVRHFPKLAVSRVKVDQYKIGETALHALARKPLLFYDSDDSVQGILNRCYYQLSGTSKMQKIGMHPKALELVKLLWQNIEIQLDYFKISELIEKPQRLIFDAAKEGNIDFLAIVTSKHPDVISKVNEDLYSIFHIAVSCRHENIFKLIYERPSIKNVILSQPVGKEDNILHLAAKLPHDQNRLKTVSGPALQMRRELWWFEEVSRLMPPDYAQAKNGNGKTPRSLFTESHEDLRREGEEWMKKTAESCMLVATLTATIIFAATLTVPGGLDNTGSPNCTKKASFIIFAISATISLMSSAFSILTFLSLITARYAEEDFLWSLLSMLLLGLSLLHISILGMMAVFCTILSIVFLGGTIASAVIGIVCSCGMVMMFFPRQQRLIFEVLGLKELDGVQIMRIFIYVLVDGLHFPRKRNLSSGTDKFT